MLKVSASKNGLKLNEPAVSAKINGKPLGGTRPLSTVIAKYGDKIDFDQLKSLGWQDVVTTAHNGEQNVITFLVV